MIDIYIYITKFPWNSPLAGVERSCPRHADPGLPGNAHRYSLDRAGPIPQTILGVALQMSIKPRRQVANRTSPIKFFKADSAELIGDWGQSVLDHSLFLFWDATGLEDLHINVRKCRVSHKYKCTGLYNGLPASQTRLSCV